MKKEKKIGIMGGTFNPIHYGHLLLAEAAREFAGLDEVIFIPSGNPYMKDSEEIEDGVHRLAMASLAILSNPYFSVSDIEIKRNGNTYTYETLEELKEKNPNAVFYFMIGADNLFSIENWKYSDKIFLGCTLIAAARGKKTEDEIIRQVERLRERYHAKILLLPEKKIDLSSTEIREHLQAGKSVRYMTPEDVCSYIREHRLYQK